MDTAQSLVCTPGPIKGTLRTADGRTVAPPADWVLLPPGDAGLTRRVKAAGPTWTVQEKVGRRMFSRGVWASSASVESIRRQLQAERATPEYARKRDADAKRRERDQAQYVVE